MGRLFGTDGVRGVANEDLTPELALSIGLATGDLLRQETPRPLVVVGRDPRLSGPMLEAALVAGLTSMGCDVSLLGIIPTPGVAYTVRKARAQAGVMISASHNPVPDNGIKIFAGDGHKLTDAEEDEIEARRASSPPRPIGEGVGQVYAQHEAIREYAQYLHQTVGVSFSGLKIVVDAGFGAAYSLAPEVLSALGAQVLSMNCEPDGSRINVGVGSTNPGHLAQAVTEERAHLGLAFDGDADRVIAVDETGEIVDGDAILAICALDLLKRGQLPQKKIAATVYSNLGLTQALQQAGGDVVITPNGDRYVLEAIRREGLALGGEQSGHLIFYEHSTTGDGVLAACQLISVLVSSGRPLSQLVREYLVRFPQVLKNVQVLDKERAKDDPAVAEALAQAQSLLAQGRIFLRPSGTEPLIRVMGEGPELEVVQRAVDLVVRAIEGLR